MKRLVLAGALFVASLSPTVYAECIGEISVYCEACVEDSDAAIQARAGFLQGLRIEHSQAREFVAAARIFNTQIADDDKEVMRKRWRLIMCLENYDKITGHFVEDPMDIDGEIYEL